MTCGFAEESQKNNKDWASTDFSRVSKSNWKLGSGLNFSNVSKKFLDATNTDFKFSVTDGLKATKCNGRKSMQTFYKTSVNGSKQPGVTWSGTGLPGSDNSPHKVNISWNDKGFMKNNLTQRETLLSGQKKTDKYLKLSATLGNAGPRHLLRTSYKVGSHAKFGSVVDQKSQGSVRNLKYRKSLYLGITTRLSPHVQTGIMNKFTTPGGQVKNSKSLHSLTLGTQRRMSTENSRENVGETARRTRFSKPQGLGKNTMLKDLLNFNAVNGSGGNQVGNKGANSYMFHNERSEKR
jgi:hypothetical protein